MTYYNKERYTDQIRDKEVYAPETSMDGIEGMPFSVVNVISAFMYVLFTSQPYTHIDTDNQCFFFQN